MKIETINTRVLKEKKGNATVIGILLLSGLALGLLASNFLGGNGSKLKDASTISNDKVVVLNTVNEIAKVQNRFKDLRTMESPSIAYPFTDDQGVHSAVAEKNGFSDLLKNEDGSEFSYEMSEADISKKPYIDVKGVKFYTKPVIEFVTLSDGSSKTIYSYKMYVDVSGYGSTIQAKEEMESAICDALKSRFGKVRTECTTTESISTADTTKAINIAKSDLVTKNAVDGDGKITVSVFETEKNY